MKRLITKSIIEMVFLEILLSLLWSIIRDSFKDWYTYKTSLRKAFKLNKKLYVDIFEINMIEKGEGVTERDKQIWIDRKHQQHDEYLKQLGER